jgi:hypothetical protein
MDIAETEDDAKAINPIVMIIAGTLRIGQFLSNLKNVQTVDIENTSSSW